MPYIYVSRFDIEECLDILEDLIPISISSQRRINLIDRSSFEAQLLDACIEYGAGKPKLLLSIWDKVPDNYRLIIATSTTRPDTQVVVQWLLVHHPELVRLRQLAKEDLVRLSVGLLSLHEDKDKFIVDICSRLDVPKIWKSWMFQENVPACRALYIYKMLPFRDNSNVVNYVQENIQPYLTQSFTGIARQCIDKLRSRYRKYFA